MMEGDEYEDQLLGDPNQLDDLIEGRDLENSENEAENIAEDAENDQGSGDEKKEKKTVKRVLNPQPKLDAKRLTGPKGIVAIEGLFKDFEFRGAGYEDHDLNRIMKRLELWGNRLFPKLQFDDLLEKVEKLGHKRPVLNFVSKIRMGLVDENTVAEDDKERDIVDVDDVEVNEDNVNNNEDVFEQLLAEQQTQINIQPVQISHPPPEAEMTITEEQRERMMRNRKLAEERRLARIKAQQERELQNAENSSVPKIASDFEIGRAADLELGNVPTTHSAQHGSDQDCLEASSAKNSAKEVELDSKNIIEVDPGTHEFDDKRDGNQPEVSYQEKVEVTKLFNSECKEVEVDRIERRAEVSFEGPSHSHADVNESMNCVNSVVNSIIHPMSDSDAKSCIESTLHDNDESIKASECIKDDVNTFEESSRDAEME